MDAFESLVSMLLRREGYWTTTSLKVKLTKAEKRRIERASTPRWELDIVAYKGSTNEILAVECKSFIDSRGVVFRNGHFERARRYKLFENAKLRRIVFRRLAKELVALGACRENPTVTLCLATGKIANVTDREGLEARFRSEKWRLLTDEWICEKLENAASADYENDVAHVVAKLICRRKKLLSPTKG
jgi:hypothetical protein